jgi:hypothetical protein
MRKLTTFTLSQDSFLTVFNYQGNVRYGAKGFGSGTQDSEQDSTNPHLGFCLVRLRWVSANIAECHLGFYQVNAKTRFNYLEFMQK